MLRIILPVLAACITSAAASYHNWKIGWRLLAPDGFLRPVITVNGQWPPPAIVVDLGEDVTVDIDNQLGNQSVSIHWHGMHQRNSNAMDGAAMVTQCPIPPGGVFRYEFKAEPAGTHYWRSGNKGQAQDGLRGLLIVRDKPHEQSLGIWREFMFTVSDWFHAEMPDIVHEYLNGDGADMTTFTDGMPMSDGHLLNGTLDLVLPMAAGKKHLFRIANVGSAFDYFISFEDHRMLVVGVDGVPVQSTPAETISIAVGQRYDVVVFGKRRPRRNYAFVAYQPDKHEEVVGELRYSDDFETPGPWIWSEPPVDDMHFRPLDTEIRLLMPNREIVLPLYMTKKRRVFVDGYPYVPPFVPTLFTALSTGDMAATTSVYGHGVNPIIIDFRDVIQLEIANHDPLPRPIHLHGHYFQVLARGYGDRATKKVIYPQIPMIRDTIVVPPVGFVLLRFLADNPGVWLLNGQAELQMASGLAVTFIEGTALLQKTQSIPPTHLFSCEIQGIATAGNCAGEVTEVWDSTACQAVLDPEFEYGAVFLGEVNEIGNTHGRERTEVAVVDSARPPKIGSVRVAGVNRGPKVKLPL